MFTLEKKYQMTPATKIFANILCISFLVDEKAQAQKRKIRTAWGYKNWTLVLPSREEVRGVALATAFFFRICFITYIRPYNHLVFWPSGPLNFRLLAFQISDLKTSGHPESRLLSSSLLSWCPKNIHFGPISYRLQQSQIPNVLPEHEGRGAGNDASW